MTTSTHVVFRYDDLAADEPGERNHNPDRRAIWEAEQSVDRLFEQAGVPWVAGVIPQANPAYLLHSTAKQSVPFSADPEKVAFVKRSMRAGRMQVAVHGFNHTNYRGARGRASEFSRSYDEQYRDLIAGRKILAGALETDDLSTFIPPFNGWNRHTAPALVKSGFKILSADRHQSGEAVTPLVNIPFTAQLWELEELLAKDRLPEGSVVVALFHPPQIARISGHEHRHYGVERMESLLAKLKTRPEVKIVNFDRLRSERSDLTATRYLAAAKLQRLRSLWSPALSWRHLPGAANDHRYLPESEYRRDCLVLSVWTGIATLGIFAGGLALYAAASSLLPSAVNRVLAIVALVGFGSSAWLLVDLARRGFHANSTKYVFAVVWCAFLIAALRHQWMLSAQ